MLGVMELPAAGKAEGDPQFRPLSARFGVQCVLQIEMTSVLRLVTSPQGLTPPARSGTHSRVSLHGDG